MEESNRHISMKLLAEDDRPREKMMSLGRQGMSDAELLAIILASGNRNESAIQLARRILSEHNNSIASLAKLSIQDLKTYKGVGTAKAVNIAAAFELGRRRGESTAGDRIKISSSRIAYDILMKRLSDLPHEEFWLLLLNRANQVMREEHLSKGGISGTVVDVRLICKSAVTQLASGVIIAHNHPSGQVHPSEQDKAITRKLREGLKMFDISLLDHLIIGEGGYYSFSDEGLL